MLPPGAWNGSHLRTKHGTGACQSRERIHMVWRTRQAHSQRARQASFMRRRLGCREGRGFYAEI